MSFFDTGESLEAFAFETLTVTNASLGLTTATYASPSTGAAARRAYITTETDSVRMRADGTDPTASVGHLIAAGGQVWVTGSADLASVRFIRTNTDATLSVTYYR